MQRTRKACFPPDNYIGDVIVVVCCLSIATLLYCDFHIDDLVVLAVPPLWLAQ